MAPNWKWAFPVVIVPPTQTLAASHSEEIAVSLYARTQEHVEVL